MNISAFLSDASTFVWGLPLMVFLVGTGLYLTARLCFIQIRGFKHAFGVLSGKYDNQEDPGEISHFKALTTALSATIGTGNIVGVAAAILTGGPGAVFWMWITACVGMATKFTSCTLAVHFRKIDADGEAHGGPMHFIEMGMGRKFKWLAVLFASFTALASFGIGNMFQVNNIVSAMESFFVFETDATRHLFHWGIGAGVAILVALVILGGIRRIAHCASILVPFMCVFYILAGIIILIKNSHLVLPGFQTIFYYAFHAPESIAGGVLGAVIRAGVARGLFSNEAGLGSAAMAHGAAKTKEPVREGLVEMVGPFIDTLLVCTITALVIVCTGSYEQMGDKGQLTSYAFNKGLPGSGFLVNIGVILFAFSTLVAWSYYGDRAVDYLFGKKMVFCYRWTYILFIMVVAIKSLDDVINFCDALNGLMAIPNLIALIYLTPVVVKLTQEYMQRTS